ncbi:MAG: ABC transporter permease [Crocinitomicaceae bacterium]
MRSVFLISWREIKQRILNRSFLLMLLLGPLLILSLFYFLVQAADEGKQQVNVLIADPGDLLEGIISSRENPTVHYSFISDYVTLTEFKSGKVYQDYDVLMEVNEKVLNNKKVFVFYRDYLSNTIQNSLRFTLERRIEEVIIEEFSDLTVESYRQMKQPLNIDFRNLENPTNSKMGEAGWVGFFFGTLIILFTLFYGMSILRGIAREKSNRVVEVLVSVVSPGQLMLGKIIGVGISALVQLLFWLLVISLGLWALQGVFFSDFFLSESFLGMHFSDGAHEALQTEFTRVRNNEMIHLIYDRVNLGLILPFFFLFFLSSYVFYGAFFSLIGAAMGSERDGQVFILPLVLLLIFTLIAGCFMVMNPDSVFTAICQYIPFTSPMAVMVHLAMGYAVGTGYLIWISLLILLFSTVIMLWLASKVFKRSLLAYGHQINLKSVFRWMTRG